MKLPFLCTSNCFCCCLHTLLHSKCPTLCYFTIMHFDVKFLTLNVTNNTIPHSRRMSEAMFVCMCVCAPSLHLQCFFFGRCCSPHAFPARAIFISTTSKSIHLLASASLHSPAHTLPTAEARFPPWCETSRSPEEMNLQNHEMMFTEFPYRGTRWINFSRNWKSIFRRINILYIYEYKDGSIRVECAKRHNARQCHRIHHSPH